MNYDSTGALAKQREQRALQEALAEDLTGQLLRRLNLLTDDGQPAN
jgi:outer membrane lipopolysaccharide assembly protein LptE/RlpB